MENRKCSLYITVLKGEARIGKSSPKNQERLLSQFLETKSSEAKKWVIVDRYIDRIKSSRNTSQPEYRRMLSDIQKGKIDTVICVSLSRISQSALDLAKVMESFDEKNIDLVCLKEGIDTTKESGRRALATIVGIQRFKEIQAVRYGK